MNREKKTEILMAPSLSYLLSCRCIVGERFRRAQLIQHQRPKYSEEAARNSTMNSTTPEKTYCFSIVRASPFLVLILPRAFAIPALRINELSRNRSAEGHLWLRERVHVDAFSSADTIPSARSESGAYFRLNRQVRTFADYRNA